LVAGLGIACALAAFPAAAATGPPELAALDATWAKVTDYQATIVSQEFSGKTTQERRFHFSFLRPNHVKAEIVDGPLRGMVAVWNGGDKVIVYHHGILAGVRVALNLHDRVVTSPRGNTVESADFGEALECYNAHAALVRARQGPEIDGVSTVELLMDDSGPLDCPGYSEKDLNSVTKDAIVVSKQTDLPLRRMRYAGDELVEQWDIEDLRVNTGLTENDFR
jgi:outer membrane lipoprotein-sorting protein